jgi:CHASE2 domain-containing sensor protein
MAGKFLGQSAEAWGLTLLAADSVPNFLAGMAPSLYTLQHMGGKSDLHEAETRASMQRAYVVGGSLALMAGAGASLVAGSWFPLVVTAAVLWVMIAQYQWALDHPHESREEMFRG